MSPPISLTSPAPSAKSRTRCTRAGDEALRTFRPATGWPNARASPIASRVCLFVSLEAEARLQVNDPVRRCGGKWSAAQAVRFAEKWRADHASRRGQIHVVKHVSAHHAERQIVASARSLPLKWPSTAENHPPAAASATSPSSSTAFKGTPRAARPSPLLAKRERLGQSQIQREVARPCPVIYRYQGFPWLRHRIENSEWRHHRVWFGGRTCERGPLVELRTTNQILLNSDVVGLAGSENHERTKAQPPRRSDRPDENRPIPHVKRRSPVILGDVVWIRRKAVRPICVGVGII